MQVIPLAMKMFCKLTMLELMELKWAKSDYQDLLIVRLGGLHTILEFLKVIGKHINSSGMLAATF